MNTDTYPHAGKPLNKTILQEILPKVYTGTRWLTVTEFQDKAEAYHLRKGGREWGIRETHAPVYNVLREYEKYGRTERQRDSSGHRWRFREQPPTEPPDRYIEHIREEIVFLRELIDTLTERQGELENVLTAERWPSP